MLDPTPSLVPLMEDAGTNSPVWMKWFQQLVALPIGYGGIRQTQSNVALPDIGAGWITLLADASTVRTPKQVSQRPGENGLTPEAYGIWEMSVNITLKFDETNAGREVQLRLYNVTEDAPRDSTTTGIGRNSAYLTFNVTFLIEGRVDGLQDLYTVQVGNGDTFTNVTQIGYRFEATLVDTL